MSLVQPNLLRFVSSSSNKSLRSRTCSQSQLKDKTKTKMKFTANTLSIWISLVLVAGQGTTAYEDIFSSSGTAGLSLRRGGQTKTSSLAHVPTEWSKKVQTDLKDMPLKERADLLGEVGEHLSDTMEELSQTDFSENELLEFFVDKALEEGKTTLKLMADASYYFHEAAGDKKLLGGGGSDENHQNLQDGQVEVTSPFNLERLSRVLKEAEDEELKKKHQGGNAQDWHHRRTTSGSSYGHHHHQGGSQGFGGHGFRTSNRLFHINRMQEAICNGDHHYINTMIDGIQRRVQQRGRSSSPQDKERRRMQEENNKMNQCEVLFDCADKMSRYDIFAFFYSDDIDANSGEVDQPNGIFQFDEKDLAAKRASIKGFVADLKGTDGSFQYNSGTCNSLLREFHRQKENDGIPDWEGGFVGQVCLAEGTTQYIRFEDLVTTLANSFSHPEFTSDRCSTNKDVWDQYRCDVVGYIAGEGDEKCDTVEDKGFIQQYLVEPLDCARELFVNQVTNGDEHFPFLQTFSEAYSSKNFIDYDFPIGINRGGRDKFGQLKDESPNGSNHPWAFETIVDLNTRFEECIDDEVGEGRPSCSNSGGSKRDYGRAYVAAVDVCVGRIFGKAVDRALQIGIGQEVSPGFVCGVKNAVVTDGKNLPGSCCLEAPYQFEDEEWGKEFDCDAVECDRQGPLFSGMNEESCDHHGGNYCPLPADCSDLQLCVSDYTDEANATDLFAYRDYLLASPNITSATDPYECGRAREYFGFEEDFIDDKQICQDVYQLRFARDFDFLNEFYGNGGGGSNTGGNCDGTPTTDVVPVLCLNEPNDDTSSSSVVQNGQAWRSINFAFSKAVDTYYYLRENAEATLCGCNSLDPAICAVFATCELLKTTFTKFIESIRFYLELAAEVSEFTYGEAAEVGNIEPIETWENTAAIYGNMELTAIYLQERFEDVAANTTVTHEKVDSLQGAVDEVDQKLVDIDLFLQEINETLVDFITPDLSDRKYAGCDKFDQNGIDNEDDCAEDLYPPSLVMHSLLPLQSQCPGGAKCIDKVFSSLEEAITYVDEAVRVEDDCGHPSSLSKDITSGGLLSVCETELMVTPKHDCTDADGSTTEYTGDSLSFRVMLDEGAPTVDCNFDSISDLEGFRMVGDYLVIDQENYPDHVQVPLLVNTADECSSELDVTVTVDSDTMTNFETVLLAHRTKNVDSSKELAMFVIPQTCDKLKNEQGNMAELCVENEENLILYKIEVSATDMGGHLASTTCHVVIDGIKKSGGKGGQQTTETLTTGFLDELSTSPMYRVASFSTNMDTSAVTV